MNAQTITLTPREQRIWDAYVAQKGSTCEYPYMRDNAVVIATITEDN